MLFLVHWRIEPEHRNAMMKRFKEKGHGEPDGVKIIGSWHSVSQEQGWAVAEAADSLLLAKWAYTWTDLNVNHMTPVVDDEEMRKIAVD